MSSRRYQSRLFQTLGSQFQQWQDQVQLRWRQLKVATAWGAQIALYPFYLIFQAGRWGGRVLGQTATHGARRLVAALGIDPIAPTDQPIQNVLAALDLQSLPGGQEYSSSQGFDWQVVLQPIAPPPKSWTGRLERIAQRWQRPLQQVSPRGAQASPLSLTAAPTFSLPRPRLFRGVASTLATRTLVLTTPDNQILDILTLDQQRRLHQRIVWEIALALRSQRPLERSRQLPDWQTWQMLPIRIRPQWSLPIRVVHRLMAWVQQQPIAQLVLLPAQPALDSPSLNWRNLPMGLTTPLPLVRTIGQVLRQIQQAHLVLQPRHMAMLSPAANPQPQGHPKATVNWLGVRPQTWDFLRRAIHRLRVGESRPLLVARSQTLETVTVPTPIRSTLPQRLGQRLRGYRRLLAAGIGAIALMPFALAVPDSAQAATAPALPLPTPVSFPAEWILDPVRARRRWLEDNDLTESSTQKTQGKIRIASEPIPGVADPTASFPGAIADWAGQFSQTTVSATHGAIDVEANMVGYEQHLLERILGTLDQTMAWIEPHLDRLWQYGQQQGPQIWQQGREVLANLMNWLKTEGIPFCQRWWPVIWTILQTLLTAVVSVLRVLGTSLWQWGWPLLQQAGRSILAAAKTWWKQQGTTLWQHRMEGIRNWMHQGWSNLWS